jgi:hypothetical protein
MTDSGWLGSELPAMPPPAGPTPRSPNTVRGALRSVQLFGHFATIMIAVNMVVDCFYAWATWNTHSVVTRAFDVGFDDGTIGAADDLSLIAGWLFLASWIAGGVVFIVWLWRARQNSEELSYGQHSRGRGWAIGSWFTPFVGFWFPYQVVRDVWRASNPNTRMTDGELSRASGGAVVGWWWAAFVVSWLSTVASYRTARGNPGDTPEEALDWLRQIAVMDTVSAVAGVIAGVLVIVIIRQVSGWQTAALKQGSPAAQ